MATNISNGTGTTAPASTAIIRTITPDDMQRSRGPDDIIDAESTDYVPATVSRGDIRAANLATANRQLNIRPQPASGNNMHIGPALPSLSQIMKPVEPSTRSLSYTNHNEAIRVLIHESEQLAQVGRNFEEAFKLLTDEQRNQIVGIALVADQGESYNFSVRRKSTNSTERIYDDKRKRVTEQNYVSRAAQSMALEDAALLNKEVRKVGLIAHKVHSNLALSTEEAQILQDLPQKLEQMEKAFTLARENYDKFFGKGYGSRSGAEYQWNERLEKMFKGEDASKFRALVQPKIEQFLLDKTYIDHLLGGQNLAKILSDDSVKHAGKHIQRGADIRISENINEVKERRFYAGIRMDGEATEYAKGNPSYRAHQAHEADKYETPTERKERDAKHARLVAEETELAATKGRDPRDIPKIQQILHIPLRVIPPLSQTLVDLSKQMEALGKEIPQDTGNQDNFLEGARTGCSQLPPLLVKAARDIEEASINGPRQAIAKRRLKNTPDSIKRCEELLACMDRAATDGSPVAQECMEKIFPAIGEAQDTISHYKRLLDNSPEMKILMSAQGTGHAGALEQGTAIAALEGDSGQKK